MRPRTLGKIVVGVIIVASVLAAVIFALESPEQAEIYKSFRAVTYAILSLTFATIYRYFED
jgi:hypothetical protein